MKAHIIDVIFTIPDFVSWIIVVDDACPEETGQFVKEEIADQRLHVLKHANNAGVGAATKTGYIEALTLGAEIVVKLDGDGQMDGRLIEKLISPIVDGYADYCKGNRFDDVEVVKVMPKLRVFGNLVLSFFSKLSSGYWHVFDPNNGFTALKRDALTRLPLTKIENRYFFESDILFRLNLIGARVVDVPMQPIYGDEVSNLNIGRAIPEFLLKHLKNTWKRIIYTYYLRDFNLASIELPLGLLLILGGTIRGIIAWRLSIVYGESAPTGTVVLVAVMILMGTQFLLAFLNQDINSSQRLQNMPGKQI